MSTPAADTPRLFLVVSLAAALLGQTPPARAEVDFSRDVLPILSDKCFHCHGPDARARKAKLRLDTKEGAFRLRKGKAVIVPGDSAASELVRRITADAEERMPPPDANRTLTPRQIDLLKRWVDEGAKWGRHWAFEPPRRPSVPRPRLTGWTRGDLDAFILDRLEKEGLRPSTEAPRETWLRRVTLDLTGLPPTLAEIDAFGADQAPNAYEKVVDRLLSSPRYGERMASAWLDLARYADTHGYQMDRYRAVWPWRDWVIQAFNRNLPYDQFITWQLAGDLLPGATKEQRLATAFNRLHLQNEEGGVVEEEFRVAYVVDRVNTFGTAFLGLTFDCTRCHDHKYDPLTQKDYYSLFSLFQNIDESGQTSYFTAAMPVPTLLLSNDATDARLAALNGQVQAKEKQLAEERSKAQASFAEWLQRRPHLATPGLVAAYAFEEIKANQIVNGADTKKPAHAIEGPKLTPGKVGNAVELNGENGFNFPGVGHFSRVDPFSLSLWLRTPSHAPRFVVLHHSKAPIDAGSRGYELLLENGRVAFGLHHMWPGNSLKVATKAAIPVDTWTHLTVSYDGSSHAAGVRIYLDGVPAALEMVRDGLIKDIIYEGGEPNLALGFRFRDNGFKGGSVDELRVFSRAVTSLEAASLAGRPEVETTWRTPTEKLSAAQREQLLDYYLSTAHAPAIKLREELHALRKQQSQTIQPVAEIMVMQEMSRPKPAYILKRGAYDAHGEPVTADTPAALPPFPAEQPRNRLGLARWLLAPEHPLTARVAVNRFWQMMFGKGLVETSDNFGSQGTPPTHPELLDWLARDFADHGWNMKRLLKMLALSAAYRQSSRVSPELLARDPGNQLLARAPARRLSAEMLRDQALAVSGLLTEKLGGPSVKPYQPEGLWSVAMGSPHYDRSRGPDLYRRSLYTFWKRTVPHPAMVTFDAAERNVCIVRRQSTSTPLQALAMLNDPQIVEAARFLAQRMLKEGGATPGEQARWVFRVTTGRQPNEHEAKVLARLFAEQKVLFRSDPKAAAKLLAVGDAKNDPKLDRVDVAAGTVLALTVLNHDASVMRR
jgi:mono/diheme cytochrome c family protein